MQSIPSFSYKKIPTPGIGVGFRSPHAQEILATRPKLDFFELLTDNHLAEGGYARQQAYAIRELYPVSMHCVGMSLGSSDPLDFTYLSKIKQLAKELDPVFISDHLCWSSFNKQHAHDLLPLPYTEEAVTHVSNRIKIIQEYLESNLLIENVSSYLSYKCSELNEWEFLTFVAEASNCKIILDVNNIFVSQYNNDIDAKKYIQKIPINLVAEIHLAGYEDNGEYLLDSHNNLVSEGVWELYKQVMMLDKTIPTLIEWDNDLPPFSTLFDEANKALQIKNSISQLPNTYAA